MIIVFTEDVILQKVKVEEYFSPQRITFFIIEKGCMITETNGVMYRYKKGNLDMTSPQNVYKLINLTDDLKVYIIAIDGNELNNKTSFVFNKYEMLHALRSKDNNMEKVSDRTFEHIISLCEQLFYYQEYEKEIAFGQQIMLSLFTSVVYILVGDLLQKKGKNINMLENSRKENITIEFLHLVGENFKKDRELQFYADQMKISTKYLSNTVREIYATV